MSRVRNDTRVIPVLVLALAALAWFTVFMATAGAGVPTSSTTTTEATTTTSEAPTTTPAPTTASTRPSTTSTASRPSSTSSSVPRSTTSSAPRESLAPTTEAPGPEIITDDTLPRRADASSGDGLSTDAKLGLVIGGLASVGVLIGLLTFAYWRHTRPQQYLTALDALADVEQKVPKDGDKTPVAGVPAVPATVGASTAAGAGTATQAFRIIDPATEKSGPEPDDSTDRPAPSGGSMDEPTTITTIEDLQGEGRGDDAARS